ncbi:MAG: hypothetical protein ACM3QY_03335 [Candidatus Levyibacteriota bacterium]
MQVLLVFAIVAVAAAYAGWVLMPQGLRRWLAGRLILVAPSRRAWLARLASNAENAGCGSCKGCATRRRPLASTGEGIIRIETRMDAQAPRKPAAADRR